MDCDKCSEKRCVPALSIPIPILIYSYIHVPALSIPPYSRDDPSDPNLLPAATRPRTLAHSLLVNFRRTMLDTVKKGEREV